MLTQTAHCGDCGRAWQMELWECDCGKAFHDCPVHGYKAHIPKPRSQKAKTPQNHLPPRVGFAARCWRSSILGRRRNSDALGVGCNASHKKRKNPKVKNHKNDYNPKVKNQKNAINPKKSTVVPASLRRRGVKPNRGGTQTANRTCEVESNMWCKENAALAARSEDVLRGVLSRSSCLPPRLAALLNKST